MDAFEQLVAELLWDEGYWVETSVKVRLTPADKIAIDRKSCPAWELDVVGYQGAKNSMLVIECKSFLDSTGVTFKELQPCEAKSNGRYKLFCESRLRAIVLNRLVEQSIARGLCPSGATVKLGLAAANIKKSDIANVESMFEKQGWPLYGPSLLREKLKTLSTRSYQNQVSSVVSKLLLRNET